MHPLGDHAPRARALLAVSAAAVVVLLAVVVGVGAAAGRQGRSSAGAPLSVVGTGRLPAPRQGSFLSNWYACGCGKRTVLDQFALSDGRRLGVVARLPGSPAQVSDPHVDPAGNVWLTLSSGPRYRSGVAGGDPAPNSCAGKVVRFDPSTQSTTTLMTFPSSTLVADAVPSPNGRLVVMPAGGCATSYFNEHLVVRDLSTGAQWTIGADAAPCHALFDAAWSADGSELVFPYGPSILSPRTHFVPAGYCDAPRDSRLAIVPSSHTTPVSSWRLIEAGKGCSYMVATFDRGGIAAVEGCSHGSPAGQSDPHIGDAYLVQLDDRGRVVLRLQLARGFDGGGIATDPRTGTVLISESQAADGGNRAFNWVWAFDGHTLRLVRRLGPSDATLVSAEPW